MKNSAPISAAMSGTFTLGNAWPVNRLGFGAMRLTGPMEENVGSVAIKLTAEELAKLE